MASSNGAANGSAPPPPTPPTTAALAQTPAEKLALITNNLQEVLNPEIVTAVLDAPEPRPLRIYWGTATTGKPHCGYFVPMLKIAEFLAAGCSVTILLADVHGFLDNLKAPIELVAERVKYYRFAITALLQAVGVDLARLHFVTGSEYQTSGASGAKYFFDLLRLSTVVSGHDASKAGSEVVKQVDSPPLSSQLYPLMQALDEEYLGVDAQFGGLDQRKIFTLASEVLPRVGFARRAHLMNPLIPGLQEGGKMSSSDPDSKIDLVDPPDVVRRKLKKAFCPPKIVEGNGVLAFVEYVLLPASALRNNGVPRFVVPRPRDNPDKPLVYASIAEMHADYLADVLQPQTLKPAVTDALLELVGPIRAAYEASAEWRDVEVKAYPPPAPVEKKKKKEKKGPGSMFPGAKGGSAAAQKEKDGVVNGAADAATEAEVVARPDGSVVGPDAGEVSVGQGAGVSVPESAGKSAEEKMKRLSLGQSSSPGHARKGSKG